MRKITMGLLACVSLWGASQAEALTVTTSSNADELAEALKGGGITIIRDDFNKPLYTGSPSASGIFINGAGTGLQRGVILTTGVASGATQSGSTGGGNGGGFEGFSSETFDFASLQLDFTTTTGDLFISFRFATNEAEFDGEGYSYFNDDIFGIRLDSVPLYFDSVGTMLLEKASHELPYNGVTQLFTYTLTGLGIGPHTLEIGIADGLQVHDEEKDSALFIGPLSATAPVPEPSTFALLGLGFGGVIWSARRKKRS